MVEGGLKLGAVARLLVLVEDQADLSEEVALRVEEGRSRKVRLESAGPELVAETVGDRPGS